MSGQRCGWICKCKRAACCCSAHLDLRVGFSGADDSLPLAVATASRPAAAGPQRERRSLHTHIHTICEYLYTYINGFYVFFSFNFIYSSLCNFTRSFMRKKTSLLLVLLLTTTGGRYRLADTWALTRLSCRIVLYVILAVACRPLERRSRVVMVTSKKESVTFPAPLQQNTASFPSVCFYILRGAQLFSCFPHRGIHNQSDFVNHPLTRVKNSFLCQRAPPLSLYSEYKK